MNALLFLVTRRFINSFRRAFNNPGRTVGTLAVIALLLAVYGGPLLIPNRQSEPPSDLLHIIPPLEIAASILTLMVCGFLILTFFISINHTRAFTEHDVLNIFPTPLPRKLVFQFSLFTRGLLGSIFGAVIVAYFLFRTSRSFLLMVPGSVAMGSAALGAIAFALLFIVANGAILQLGVNCGLSVFCKRTPKGFLWTVIAAVLTPLVGVLLYRVLEYPEPGVPFSGSLLHQLNQPPCVWLFFPFRAIADCALVSLGGWTSSILPAAGLWTALFIIGQRTLGRHAPSMYEYAIHLAQGNTRRREMMMNKSFYSWGRLHRHNTKEPADRRGWRWLDEWTPVRTSALFWRNLVLIRRSGGLLAIKIYIALTALFGCIIAALRVLKPTADQSGLLALGGTLQFILIFAFVPSSIAWISQTLKRFEIQKPLPIPPKHAVLAELLTPTLAVAGSNLFGMITLSILFPHRWEIFVLGYLTMGSGYMLMSCLLFIVLLFNPDPNDTLQRMLFGIYQLIVFVLAFLPAAVVVGFGFVLHVPPLIQGVVVLLVNAACMYLLVALAAKKYESFNPLE